MNSNGIAAGALMDGLAKALRPLDVARRALYRFAVPWLGPWIRQREVRIALHGVSVVLFSGIAALVAPLVLLAVGPLVLGVPHLLADVRYLVVRPGLHRRTGALLIGGLLVLSTVLVDLRIGLFAAALFPLFARGTLVRRVLVCLPLLLLLAMVILGKTYAFVAIAHIHNLVAVAIWMTLGSALHITTRESLAARWIPSALFLVGGALLLSGWMDAWLGLRLPGAPSLSYHLGLLAPGLDPVIGTRWVVLFAYAQAVHYGLWLRVMPEEARPRPAPRSWKASLVALRREFGDRALATTGLLFVGLAVWGLFDLMAAREGYLRLALFHGPMELGILALVAAEGRGVLRP